MLLPTPEPPPPLPLTASAHVARAEAAMAGLAEVAAADAQNGRAPAEFAAGPPAEAAKGERDARLGTLVHLLESQVGL